MENQEVSAIRSKKQFLKRYKKNLTCINRLELKLYLLDERIQSVRTSNLSGMPRGGTPVSIEELISDKQDLEKRIEKLKNKGSNLKDEILYEIDLLEDSRYCEILEAFFIDCKSMEEIAEAEGYTLRHIYTLYTEAIRLLTVLVQ